MTLMAVALIVASTIADVGIAGSAEDSDWVFVAQWVPSRDEPAPTLYFDTKRIETDGDVRRGYSMMDYNKPATSSGSERMLSQVIYFEVDCTKQTMATLETAQYADHMGHGTLIYDHTVSKSDLKLTHYSPKAEAARLAQRICTQPLT